MKKYSLADLKPLLLANLDESRLINHLKKLSRSFTIRDDFLAEYTSFDDYVSAYTAFYLPTNYPKFSFIAEFVQEGSFCDVGCGPGTYSLALLDAGFTGEIVCVDQSPLMLEQAKKIISTIHPKAKVHYTKEIPKKCETIFFGNSLNEMSDHHIGHIIERHEFKTFMFLEPGTKDFFSRSMNLREILINKNFHIHFPCGKNSACPMGGDDWCHQKIHLTHADDIERISQIIKLDRRTLPFIAHVYSLSAKEDKNVIRTIQLVGENKHSIEIRGCLNNKIEHFEIPKRTLPKKGEKQVKQKSFGYEFEFEVLKNLENKTRIKIKI